MNCHEAEKHFDDAQKARYTRLVTLLEQYKAYGVGHPLGGFQDFEYELLLLAALSKLCEEV